MAKLAHPPTNIAARASKLAKPAVPRRAPIQSAASTTKASIARPSLSISAASRTTLHADSKALQYTRSARNASAVASRTNSRVLQALGYNFPKNGGSTNCYQKKHTSKQQTRIPGPISSMTIAKWAKMRSYGAIKYQVYVKEKMSEVQEYEDDSDSSFLSDTNPDLLHDDSFDETRDPYEQSCPQIMFNRFQALYKVLKHTKGVIGRFPGVSIPRYGCGDHFMLGRRRPRAVLAPKASRGIHKKLATTLKHLKIDHSPAPSANTLEQIKADKRFGFGFESRVEPEEQQVLPAESVSVVSETPLSGPTEPSGNEARSDMAVDGASKSTATNSPEPVPAHKTVRFAEKTVEPLLYHREAYAKDVKTLFELGDDWTPIKLNTSYPGSSQATGFDTMFMQTSRQTISLKRRVAIRFKAIQEYERRRHQDHIAAGEHPSLGQLEYGNADYKISLQVTDVVTAHDIGTFVEPGKFNLPASICSGPLLHFGGFARDVGGSFEDTLIPTAMAAAYRMPVQWRKAPKDQVALDEWVASAFPALQQAKLEE